MSHTVVSKLNRAAREHTNANGATFFVSLGDLKGIKVEHSERRACNALKNASVCVTWRLVSAGSGA